MKKFADAGLCLTIIVVVLCSLIETQAQEPTSTPTPPAAGQTVATTWEVIVTGSNIPTAEEVGPQPVYLLNRDLIFELGVRSATDLVLKLPVVAGASINENVTNGGDGRVEVNLRGILPKETLVLQDGRRLAPVGFAGDTVDLNMFPVGLIDHIDILLDGASAVYGSDAVDGVFNVWLIHRFQNHAEVYFSYGNTNLGASNDQAEELAYVLGGVGDDKTDIVLYAEWYNRDAIYSRDRDISSNADYRRFGGADVRSFNYAGRVGSFVYQPSLNGGALSPTPHAFPNPNVFDVDNPQYVFFLDLPRKQQAFNFVDFTSAIASVDREYLYGSLIRDFCDKYLTLFADFKYVRTFWDGARAPAAFTPDVFTDATHPFGISLSSGISVPIQNPFNPFTEPDYISPGGVNPNFPNTQISAAPPGTGFTRRVRYRALEAGPVTDKITTDNLEITAGLKGNLGEFGDYFKTWNWESGFRYNEDDRTERFGPVVNTVALRAALLDTDPATAFNPFGINQNSPAVIDKVLVTTQRLGKTSLILEDLKLSGDLWNLPAGPIAFAVGGEHRTEDANDQPDSLTASGQIIGSANTFFGPTKGSRDVWSIYWEVRVPVTSPVWNCPGLYSLELGYQERYDNYSDFGSTERPKFFFRWQPIDSSLTLRGTYNEAYHAPTLRDLFHGALQGTAFLPDPQDPFSGVIVPTSIRANPDLKPETAYEWTYGAVVTPGKWWSPLQGLTVSADFYHIDIRGVTVQLDAQFLVNHEAEFPGLVIRGPPNPFDPLGPIVFLFLPEENLGRFIEEGWDYAAVYSFDTSRLGHGAWGTVTLTLSGTYINRAVLQAVPGAREESVVGKFGAGFRPSGVPTASLGSGSFTHNRWYASLFYDGPQGSWLGGVDTGFTVHYIGDYWDNRFSTIDVKPRKIREWTTLDFILNYTFNLPAAPELAEVPGYAKDAGKNAKMENGKGNNIMPVSTAEYSASGWRAWFNNTTITLGVNNVFDSAPPLVLGSGENGYDEATANIRGRVWYVALKKRF